MVIKLLMAKIEQEQEQLAVAEKDKAYASITQGQLDAVAEIVRAYAAAHAQDFFVTSRSGATSSAVTTITIEKPREVQPQQVWYQPSRAVYYSTPPGGMFAD